MAEGGPIKRHRPWDTRNTDKYFWDRFYNKPEKRTAKMEFYSSQE